VNNPTVQLPVDRQSLMISIAAAKWRCAIRAPLCDGMALALGDTDLVSVVLAENHAAIRIGATRT
jgi:hypothetical protein